MHNPDEKRVIQRVRVGHRIGGSGWYKREATVGGATVVDSGAGVGAGAILATVSFFLLRLPHSSGSARATLATRRLNRHPADRQKSKISFMPLQI